MRVGGQFEPRSSLEVAVLRHDDLYRERQGQQPPAHPPVVAPRQVADPGDDEQTEAHVDRVARDGVREHLAEQPVGDEVAPVGQQVDIGVDGDPQVGAAVVRARHELAVGIVEERQVDSPRISHG